MGGFGKLCCETVGPGRGAKSTGRHDLGSKFPRRLVSFIGLAIVLAASCEVDAQSTQLLASPENIPEFRLAAPQWQPLPGGHIRALFSNSSLLIDESYAPYPGMKVSVTYLGGCPPVETFFEDGRWRLDQCQRGPRTYEGNWAVESHNGRQQLCVAAADRLKECRFVWQGTSSNSVIMEVALGGDSNTLSAHYNPYRIVKRVIP